MTKQFQRLSKVIAKSLNLTTQELHEGFRLARIEEIGAVSRMRKNVFGRDISEDDESYLSWRYFEREGYPSTLWVYELEGEIIGAMGTEPVEITLKGDVLQAVRSMDAIVCPEFDNRGLGAWMVLALQEQYDCILVSGGNENSTSMLKKMFTALPVRKNYKVLLKSNDFLSQKLPATFSSFVMPFANVCLKAFLAFKWNRIPESNAIDIKKCSGVDSLLECMPDSRNLLADVSVVRDKPYIKWRYLENPRSDFKLAMAFDGEQLMGFIIYSYSTGCDSCAMSRGRIVDWAVYDSNNPLNTLSLLLKHTVKDLKLLGAEQVFMILNDSVSGLAAETVGFSLRNVDTRFFVYHKSLAKSAALFSASSWFQSMSDSDGV